LKRFSTRKLGSNLTNISGEKKKNNWKIYLDNFFVIKTGNGMLLENFYFKRSKVHNAQKLLEYSISKYFL
jgi:hypothetical protein